LLKQSRVSNVTNNDASDLEQWVTQGHFCFLLGDNLMSGYQFILALSSAKFLGVYPAIVVFLWGNVLGIVRS
jgi:hypothetical protein